MGIKAQRRLTSTISYTILIIWSLILFFPMYWVVMMSFKNVKDLAVGATYIPWLDFQPSLHAWRYLFIERITWFMQPFMNSVIVAFVSSIIALVIGSMAGYALARFDYGGRNNSIVLGFMSQRIFPGALFILAFLVMFRELNLLDTRLALIIVYASGAIPFIVWVMRDFFAGLPIEIEESALIDGASRLIVIFRIAMPLAAPGLVAVFVLSLIGAWNEYLVAVTLTFTNSITIPLFMQMQVARTGYTEWWNMSAIALVSVIPMVVAGMALEKYITGGLTFGALKG
ncbi:carbohydrate ABC transporter permease [Chloroflexi bacterium TSY]|nr:carbohydrate ABC transporter permease [Chloroflexi bacterium TSY]